MSNPTQYANQSSGTFNLADTNAPARYKCNNLIGSGGIPIADAQKTYEKLYDIYNTNTKSEIVSSSMFIGGDSEHCLIGDIANIKNGNSALSCPHRQTNNILAYTGDDNSQKVYVKDLKFYLDDCGARIRDYDNANTSTASYKPVKDYAVEFRDGSYNKLVSTRSGLDNKMNEILGNNKNSILYEKQGELDATVYSTLLWTVMVTSLLYYVFTKI